MLYISKWKAAAILLTALICCLLAVPNFFPESTVKRWPEWAQRHIVLGLDLQGGSHILLEVDANDVRRQKLLALQDDVRRVLREARIGLTRAPRGPWQFSRGHYPRERPAAGPGEAPRAVAAAQRLPRQQRPALSRCGECRGRTRPAHRHGAGDSRTHPAGRGSIGRDHRQARQPAGPGRAVDPTARQRSHPGAGAGSRRSAAAARHSRQDRQADVPPRRHLDAGRASPAGAAASGLGHRLWLESREPAALSAGKAGDRVGRGAHRCTARLRPADQRTDRVLQVQHVRRPQIRPGHAGERRTAVCDRAR